MLASVELEASFVVIIQLEIDLVKRLEANKCWKEGEMLFFETFSLSFSPAATNRYSIAFLKTDCIGINSNYNVRFRHQTIVGNGESEIR